MKLSFKMKGQRASKTEFLASKLHSEILKGVLLIKGKLFPVETQNAERKRKPRNKGK